jgi:retron-type reverse transcriptase
MLIQAYNVIKSKPGNMVPGSNEETLDGLNWYWINNTSEKLLNESYKPNPARRVFIPKANGKLRPLGISSPRDKIVQQSLLFVLETILEPKFSSLSHGFRPRRGGMPYGSEKY